MASELQNAIEVSDEHEDPQHIAERRELNEWVLRAVEALPDRLRGPTVLYYYDYLTVAEIAGLLEISESAAKVRLHRSRNALRHTISNRYNAEYFREYRQRRVEAMVRVQVIDVARSSGGVAMLLFDRAGVRVLPIFVGATEAAALSQALVAKTFSRPLTYELIHDLLGSLGAEVRHVRIESLQRPGGVFIGLVTLELDGLEREVDARPSDAINLAMRSGAPIYVAPAVMEVAATVDGVSATSRFRPKGAEELASRSLEFASGKKTDQRSAEPITDDATVAERVRLLSDYVQNLVEDA
jgi:hypothetical protein